MVGKNNCIWLRISSLIYCNRFCDGTYCALHNHAIRKLGRAPPIPCRRCGRGTNSIAVLCVSCGSDCGRKRLGYAEKRAKKQFPLVLKQLVENANS